MRGAWVSTAYLIGEIVVIPLTDFMARVFSTRRYLLTNVVLFLMFSVLCGFARNLGQMIVFRALQGFTGGVDVEISRGTEGSTLIKDGTEIPTRYTAIQHLLTGAPELVAKGNELLDDAQKFLTAQNIAAAGRIMANFQEFK